MIAQNRNVSRLCVGCSLVSVLLAYLAHIGVLSIAYATDRQVQWLRSAPAWITDPEYLQLCFVFAATYVLAELQMKRDQGHIRMRFVRASIFIAFTYAAYVCMLFVEGTLLHGSSGFAASPNPMPLGPYSSLLSNLRWASVLSDPSGLAARQVILFSIAATRIGKIGLMNTAKRVYLVVIGIVSLAILACSFLSGRPSVGALLSGISYGLVAFWMMTAITKFWLHRDYSYMSIVLFPSIAVAIAIAGRTSISHISFFSLGPHFLSLAFPLVIVVVFGGVLAIMTRGIVIQTIIAPRISWRSLTLWSLFLIFPILFSLTGAGMLGESNPMMSSAIERISEAMSRGSDFWFHFSLDQTQIAALAEVESAALIGAVIALAVLSVAVLLARVMHQAVANTLFLAGVASSIVSSVMSILAPEYFQFLFEFVFRGGFMVRYFVLATLAYGLTEFLSSSLRVLRLDKHGS